MFHAGPERNGYVTSRGIQGRVDLKRGRKFKRLDDDCGPAHFRFSETARAARSTSALRPGVTTASAHEATRRP